MIKYPEDTKRIRDILRNNEIDVSLEQCQTAWRKYSEIVSSDWANLPSDREILASINQYFV